MINYFQFEGNLELESGENLDGIQIAYSVYGDPNAKQTVWVCHALSGSSEVFDWWPGLFGQGQVFNPANFKVICANVIGGCYGSTGPSSLKHPLDFPLLTVRDLVKAHQLLAEHLGITKVDVLIGASLGGQQALEWSIQDPEFVDQLILVATNAQHSPYGRAFNEAQRLALEADQTFGTKDGGDSGLKAARGIAMLSYRSYDDFSIKQSDAANQVDNYRAASYINYQGRKFVGRFDAHTYWYLSKVMDSHDVTRNRDLLLGDVLAKVQARTLVIGVDSDTLFPLTEQELLADLIPGAELGIVHSPHGHDAFLIEYAVLSSIIADFLGGRAERAAVKTTLKPKNLILN